MCDSFRHDLDALGLTYFEVKRHVTICGFGPEIDWQAEVSLRDIDAEVLLQEAAWVILSTGMSERVIRKIFAPIGKIFFEWRDVRQIVTNHAQCRRDALEVFCNSRKIDAIIRFANRIMDEGFELVHSKLMTDTIPYLKTFDFIGPVTAYHLAKNLGLDVAKEDRHLARMAEALGFQCGTDLCEVIADHLHETVRVVDVVLWRFATLEPKYCSILKERLQAYSWKEYGVLQEQLHIPKDHSCVSAYTPPSSSKTHQMHYASSR